jgi:HPt (histidine-containing phosphotransfer) domain-containing protein
MARIAAAFVDDAPQRLKAAHAGVRAGDAHAAALEIHSLRGAAGYARLSALQKELEVLEKLADAGDLAAVSKGLQQVEPLLIQSMASLNQWVSRPGND